MLRHLFHKLSAKPVSQAHKYSRVRLLVSNIVLGALLFGMFPATAQDFRGQRIVQILQEPRHRTVHQDGDIYLLDVQINPGDQTLPHTHDAAILYTFISNGDGPLYGRVSGNTDYVEQNFTHAVSNAGPNLFRIVALTNYGTGLAGSSNDAPTGVTGELQVENDWFRSYRITLGPGESTPAQTHANPSVVIQVTPGTVHVSRDDGLTAELAAMADWTWRDEGSSYTISNRGSSEVEVVVNEARR